MSVFSRVLFCMAVFAFIIALHSSAQNDDGVVALKDCNRITIRTTNGWKLTIMPSGEGKLNYGDSDLSMVSFGTGTFDFSAVYRALVGIPPVADGVGKHYTLTFVPNGSAVVYSRNVAYNKYVPMFFEYARDHAEGFADSDLAQSWREDPPDMPPIIKAQ